MEGHPTLLRSPLTQQFLYHGFYKNFNRLAPYIRGLMDEPAEAQSQRGAELACIAAISPLAIESEEAHATALRLAAEAITGPKPLRRGAARVYAVNRHQGSSQECLVGLTRLSDDEDEGVQNLVSGLFSKLRGEHLIARRNFLGAFASSRSLAQGMRAFSKYLWEYGLLEPATTLSLIATALNNPHDPRDRFNYSGGEKLIRVVLRIYADSGSTNAIRRASMDVFDKLMERHAGSAYRVLEEWDRV